jgi:hypothetical protein
VRGFAVVHCIGILTSMFSAVFFSRGLVNFWYGRQKKLKTVSIGTVWRPENAAKLIDSGNARKPEGKRRRGPRWNFSRSVATFRSCGMR